MISESDLGVVVDSANFEFKVVVQKIAYILEKLSDDYFGLKFEWFSLGPYSRSIQNYYHVVAKFVKEGGYELSEEDYMFVKKVEQFLSELRDAVGYLDPGVLEAVSSLIMLCRDVYPRVDDPLEEFHRRKNGFRDISEKLWTFLKSKGICA